MNNNKIKSSLVIKKILMSIGILFLSFIIWYLASPNHFIGDFSRNIGIWGIE